MIGDLMLLASLGRCLDLQISGAGKMKPKRGVEIAPGLTIRDVLMRSLLKIRSKGKGLDLLKANRAQMEYSQRCTNRNIVLKARQLGITTYVAARFFIETITAPGTLTVQVAHNQESAEEIFKIVRRFWDNLPALTKCGTLVTSHANTRQIVFPRIDSEYRVATASDPNAGRGMTIHNLHCSEVARWPKNGEDVLASLRAGVPENGQIVLESTPNGASGVFYEEWQRAEETGYTKHFFPWWYEEGYRKSIAVGQLTQEEEELVQRHKLKKAQIAWRRQKWSELRGMAAQEFAEDAAGCFRASGECVFDLESIEKAVRSAGQPIETVDNGRLVTWLPPQTGKQYIMGVDPAGGGTEGDYACAEVIERETGMQCAELHGHYPPRELATKLMELGRRYNEALIAIERNNHGHAVLAHVRNAGYGAVFVAGKEDGWLTTAATRPAMIENLASVLTSDPALFHSVKLLNECRTFLRHVDGSSGAAAGTHDDSVMAMAIALVVRRANAGKLNQVVNVGSLET
jgi:hypothetical protein